MLCPGTSFGLWFGYFCQSLVILNLVVIYDLDVFVGIFIMELRGSGFVLVLMSN